MNNDFPRIKRLPPYVFNITNELKMAARHRGEDIIDLSMGNPDGDTPKHIVDKMIEVAQRPGTHGYSASRGIPRLRKAISDWYKRRWDVDIDPDKEAIVTIGSKEGIAHLMLATCDRGDTVLVPNPSYPIHIYGSIIAGADVRSVRMGPGIDFFSEFERAVTETPLAASDWQTLGTSTFAGGVSDSIYGASVYSYTDSYADINTSARKAWFFFDDEVVCLGAGIHSTSQYPVYTTVNQCLSTSEKAILRHKNKQTEIVQGSFNYTSPEWILHNKIGYLFPNGGNVFVANQQQTGSWYDINHTAPKDCVQKDVFTICLDHGKQPSDAIYAYIIVPGMQTTDEVKKYQKKKNIEILSNTENLQAVRSNKSDILQMIFYCAGEFTYKDLTVKADKACALMVKIKGQNEMKLHIEDPGQTHSNITIDIRMRKQSKTINCDYRNSGIYAGSTKAFDIVL